MPFPYIVKVFNPLRLIQKLRNKIDELHVKNRKLADENDQLKLRILDLSDQLSREIEKYSRDIDVLNSNIDDLDEYLYKLSSENQEYEQTINDLEWKLKNAIRRSMIQEQESKKFDF